MDTRKIYVVGGESMTANWMQGQLVSTIDEADIVVFPGGPDVNPERYGEKKYPTTFVDDKLDQRDEDAYLEAFSKGKKLVGICRGAQFLCVMAQGKLVQHMTSGGTRHPVFTYDGTLISVSSSHHQAMYPWKLPQDDYAVLGWTFNESKFHLDGDGREVVNGIAPLNMEVEIAYFDKIDALCIQSHPEWQFTGRERDAAEQKSISYFQSLLSIFLSGHNFKVAINAYGIPA